METSKYNKNYFAKPFRLSFLCNQGARVNGFIIHIGDSVQYFGFNKQVLAQTKKEMHTVVNCRIILYCRPQTILYVNTPSYLVLNINDDNLFKKNLEHYVYEPF
jgi:hypothetical protein